MSGTQQPKTETAAIAENDSLSAIRHVLVSLRRRRKLAALVFLLIVGLGVAYAVLHTRKYTATALIFVEPRTQQVVDSKDVVAEIGRDSDAVESQVALLRSAAVSPEILQKFAVYTDPEYNRPSLLASMLSLISPVGATEAGTGSGTGLRTGDGTAIDLAGSTRRNKAIAAFERNLKVNRREKTYILEVSFTSADPVKASSVANEIARHYLRGTSNRRREASREAASWIDGRIARLRGQAEESERAVADFKARHGIVDLGNRAQGSTLRRDEISRLNDHVNTARAETERQKARYLQVQRAVSSGRTGDLPEVLTSTTIGNLRIMLTNLKLSEIRAMRTLGARHPKLEVIREEIRTVRGQIDAEIRRILAGARSSYEAAKANQAGLEAQLKALEGNYAAASSKAVRLQELERNAEADRKVLEVYLRRQRETTQQVSLSKPDAQIVSLARIPIEANPPGTLLILVIAAIAGFAMALGLAVITNTSEYEAVTA